MSHKLINSLITGTMNIVICILAEHMTVSCDKQEAVKRKSELRISKPKYTCQILPTIYFPAVLLEHSPCPVSVCAG